MDDSNSQESGSKDSSNREDLPSTFQWEGFSYTIKERKRLQDGTV